MMKPTLKFILLLLVFISCNQRYSYLKKVRVARPDAVKETATNFENAKAPRLAWKHEPAALAMPWRGKQVMRVPKATVRTDGVKKKAVKETQKELATPATREPAKVTDDDDEYDESAAPAGAIILMLVLTLLGLLGFLFPLFFLFLMMAPSLLISSILNLSRRIDPSQKGLNVFGLVVGILCTILLAALVLFLMLFGAGIELVLLILALISVIILITQVIIYAASNSKT